ncbi:hypothetical protein HNQ80_001190 [Anaerosolibacter carboniphilus]|uniref:TniQ protein n=1 Tax=Anaerosolibacter carboniphilus TaxID=1417629 RepID=A0A841KP79_9FIRM|nr:TnsD family Tn7-like transposition protein [Anaerosolibacter carboniphilus]MBB6215101.1 hypothetical protein [Anaerosolibacter carboniphilus]
MMTFFPVPYDDEVLYSILARYHIRSGNISLKSTLEDIFSKSSITSVMDLPSHINRIIKNMPINTEYTSDEIIEKYTLYPFYTAFLPLAEAAKIKNYMKEEEGGRIYNKIGLMASSISFNQYFKFCPQCNKEDMKKYGELYWHRVHQIPGIFVCPQHKVMLHDSEVDVRGFNKHEYKPASFDVCKLNNEALTCSDGTFNHLTNMAADALSLLCNNFHNKPLEWFREQYINKLKVLGYANSNGNVKQKELLTDFVDYYGDNLLIILQSYIVINSEYNWLTEIFRRKNKSTHPIRHLLLMRFLGISAEQLFNDKIEYKPFGNGPWPCLNSASEHYRELTIGEIKIKYGNDSKSPLGIFSCSCGFSYMRTGPDREEDDKFKITRMITFGQEWEARLKDIVTERLSLRETAKHLQVDPNTVKKYAEKLGLKTYWKKVAEEPIIVSNKNVVDLATLHNKQELYRMKWLALQKVYPEKSKTELCRDNKAVSAWLYKNDREWLKQHSPQLRSNRNVNLRVDWEQRDSEILQQVEKLVQEMLSIDKKPSRITISSIGSKVGLRPLLEKHLDKLPRTKKYMEQYLESIRDFQTRRIKWAIQILESEGEEILLWKIFRRAGIRMEYQQEIEKEVIGLINDIRSR